MIPICRTQPAGIVAVQVWNHLVIKAANKPVSGNMGGSYLTFFSSNGLTFGIINIIGNFGTVFCDQAYWVCSVPPLPLLPQGTPLVFLSLLVLSWAFSTLIILLLLPLPGQAAAPVFLFFLLSLTLFDHMGAISVLLGMEDIALPHLESDCLCVLQQSAIAARPSAANKGYLLGGLLWCAPLHLSLSSSNLKCTLAGFRSWLGACNCNQ